MRASRSSFFFTSKATFLASLPWGWTSALNLCTGSLSAAPAVPDQAGTTSRAATKAETNRTWRMRTSQGKVPGRIRNPEHSRARAKPPTRRLRDQAHQQREEGGAFEKGRDDDHGGLNAAGRLGLAGHALQSGG